MSICNTSVVCLLIVCLLDMVNKSSSKRLMTTANYRLQTALTCLNTLIDQGYEFPEAVDKTLEALAVNRDELVSTYDSQA